ncbi:hypothetical protein SK128_027940 [Halocaridina rubra]|uniref:Uncharacterized protein n=1 Tax=Halocaridina rubra TaxID=373956 RepID=A0AAN8X227_HALRR
MKRARLQEDAQAYEAQISQAYTPIAAPSPQQINQHPSTMTTVASHQDSIGGQASSSTSAPPAPMASQSTSASTPSSSRQVLCCDESSYEVGSTHSYEQPLPLNRYNSPILKMSHSHHQPSLEKYEATPESPYKYGSLHPQQQDYDVSAPGSSSAHEYDPLPPQVPVASDEESLVYPNVGVENQTEPPTMQDPHIPPGYFSHYPLESQGNLEPQDPLDYSDLDALFDGGPYPPPGEAGNSDSYQGYQQY